MATSTPAAGSRPDNTSQNCRLVRTPAPSSDGQVISAWARIKVAAGGAFFDGAGAVFLAGAGAFLVWASKTGAARHATASARTSERIYRASMGFKARAQRSRGPKAWFKAGIKGR